MLVSFGIALCIPVATFLGSAITGYEEYELGCGCSDKLSVYRRRDTLLALWRHDDEVVRPAAQTDYMLYSLTFNSCNFLTVLTAYQNMLKRL